MHPDITQFNNRLEPADQEMAGRLARIIDDGLSGATSKIWHAHPVWFLDGNPTVGYSRQKRGMRLMFWSGADFDEPGLNIEGKKFKDASVFYQSVSDINEHDLRGWLEKSKAIRWDYKNIVKRKGKLVRLLAFDG